MSKDIRQIADPLRESRNASFHVGRQDVSWDLRFFAIMKEPDSAKVVRRVHRGFGRLFFEEAQARGDEAADEPDQKETL
jgi:hypothetical protein